MLTVGDIMIGTDGSQQTGGEDYVPPPNGGGSCITARDCYYFNGTCHDGSCKCPQNKTGSYCQLEKSEKTGIADVIAKHKEASTKQPDVFKPKEVKVNPDAPKPVKEQNLQIKRKPAPKLVPVDPTGPAELTPEGDINNVAASEPIPDSEAPGRSARTEDEDMVPIKMTPRGETKTTAKEPKGKKRSKKGSRKGKGGDSSDEEAGAEPGKPAPKRGRKDKSVPDEEELYGLGGLYPAPYAAGKSKTFPKMKRSLLILKLLYCSTP